MTSGSEFEQALMAECLLYLQVHVWAFQASVIRVTLFGFPNGPYRTKDFRYGLFVSQRGTLHTSMDSTTVRKERRGQI